MTFSLVLLGSRDRTFVAAENRVELSIVPARRLILSVVVLLAFAWFAAWQWREYGRERQLAREAVASSADSIMNALVGGVRSHRRLGHFFTEQIESVLEELVRTENVHAAALVSEDGRAVLSAGDAERLHLAPPPLPGQYWDETGFRLATSFSLPSEAAGPSTDRQGGGGRGWGKRLPPAEIEEGGAFLPGETVTAVLVVARDRADHAILRAFWSRLLVVAAGWAVLICVAMAWRATVRLAEERGRGRALEVEARHLRELSQAAAGLAHETRNPLGLIRGWTQRLADPDGSVENTRQQAQRIVEECDRLTARINQFLAFARPHEPQLDRFDPAEVVAELAVLLEPDLAAKQVTLQTLSAGHTVLADREMLRQALFNLLQNAIQSSAENQCVETSVVRGPDGMWRLEVADRGSGVMPEHVERLFTPYFTTRPGGTGLGLAIVRRIAAVHGWEAGYACRSGGGAVFRLQGIHD